MISYTFAAAHINEPPEMLATIHTHEHPTHNNPFFTTSALTIFAISITTIFLFTAICCVLQYLIQQYLQDVDHYDMVADLEACRPLLDERQRQRQRQRHSRRYRTFSSMSHEAFTRDREVRRMMRDERVREAVEGTYRISAQRNKAESVSDSGDDNEEGNEGSDEESSESESGSSDDSEREYDVVVEGGELMSMSRPALPKRVVFLRRFGR